MDEIKEIMTCIGGSMKEGTEVIVSKSDMGGEGWDRCQGREYGDNLELDKGE